MRALLAVLIVAGALAGCSRRERLNPFDPGNPTTGGRPAGFVALAGQGHVVLRWQASSISGGIGFQLERRVAGDSAFVVIARTLPPAATSYTDFGLANGVDHTYRLSFVFDDGRTSLPAEDVATPGSLLPWVADFGNARLVRLTADGRHVVESLSLARFAEPVDVAVDRSDGRVWACAPLDGSVTVHDPFDSSFVRIEGLAEPSAVSVDPTDGTAWIADSPADAVFHFTPFGTPASPGAVSGAIDGPLDVAVDASRGVVWVCERNGNRVRLFGTDGQPIRAADLGSPSRVAIDASTGEAWVTSFEGGRVVRFSAAGVAVDTVDAVDGPIGVAVDFTRRRVWVADAVADQLVALRIDGSVEFRVGNLGTAREIAVDSATGDAWVTLPEAGAVAIVSENGVERRRLGGFGAPYGIALDDVDARGPGVPRRQRTKAMRADAARSPWTSRTQ